jgi:phosphoglycerate dehydrogenase-like enzyme
MSEHFFALLLSLSRQIAPLVRAQSRGEWVHDTRQAEIRLFELRGKTLGIIGWGKIGAGVAHLAEAFGMRVLGTRRSAVTPVELDNPIPEYVDSPWLEPTGKEPDLIYPAARMGEVLAHSDVVLLLLPLTDETKGGFGEEAFRSMKRGALFFNLGRGAVVDENALVHALQEGSLGGAGLDVFDREPLPRSSPLWSMPNVVVSPHLGGVGEHTRERGAHLFEVNLRRFLDGQRLLNLVDREGGY